MTIFKPINHIFKIHALKNYYRDSKSYKERTSERMSKLNVGDYKNRKRYLNERVTKKGCVTKNICVTKKKRVT